MMEVNFKIASSIALNFEGRYLNLHDNFDFAGFDYKATDRALKMTWIKAIGGWVGSDELNSFVLLHLGVRFLAIKGEDEESEPADNVCLSEITFFPSTAREINDSLLEQVDPKEGDDILYFFENGTLIRIHCERIILIPAK